MKKIFLTLFLLVFSNNCFSEGAFEIVGLRALSLLGGLQAVGAYVDCGAGTCGTLAEDIRCIKRGISTGNIHYDCDLIAQDETGTMVPRSAIEPAAGSLYETMVTAGLPADCGAGTCGVQATRIECLIHLGGGSEQTYNCFIEP